MGRLIDLDNLLEDMIHCNIGRKSLEEVIRCLNVQPTVEAVPVEKVDTVLDRLENAAFWTPQTYDEDGFGNDDSEEVVLLDRVLEIVKEELNNPIRGEKGE